MKSVFESVIRKGGYDLPNMLNRIDAYHIDGKLTDDERAELYSLARNGAKPENSVDLMAKVSELAQALAEANKRIDALEKQNGGIQQETGSDENDKPAEYVSGVWYYKNDRVSFGGATYTCIAPEGQVCTWSPAEYPAYWQKDA